MRSFNSSLVMARLKRVTTTSRSPPVSRRSMPCGRSASEMRATGTVPVSPRSGARKTAISAAAPAFSTRSPIRTISEETTTSSFSCGTLAGAAVSDWASWPSTTRTASAKAMRIIVVPQRIRFEVADSIWSAAVMTLPFIS
jgi:hypothetical protein